MYDFSKIEKQWQDAWAEQDIYRAKDKSKKPKKYVLIEFPYPSGEGLHMGHLRPYVAGDVYSRFWRMKGFETMYPIGWDAFGLPAENFAIRHKVHPRISTENNIQNAKRQLKSWGIGFDWSREINTTDPAYYKWTQWIFLQFFKAGLAYEATGLINWCPKDKTGLANEEVIDGKCERCGTNVEKKELKQWYLKITAYADKLIAGLKKLDWPEPVKLQQENWIGRSLGSEIEFKIQNSKFKIFVFTTRADTLFGATYMVLAPEHPLVAELLKIKNKKENIKNADEVKRYIAVAKKKTEVQRTELTKEKTGVELQGIKAINPATKKEIPVWIADYVLASYGTGAIMGVPAHDERDFEFAKKFKLPIKMVICPNYPEPKCPILDKAFVEYGYAVDSGKFTGMDSEKAKSEITKFVGGKMKTQYHLRDWVFSRQRYWGEPIPLVFCEDCAVKIKNQKSKIKNNEFSKGEILNPGWVSVSENDLPVKLPEVKKYEPTGTGESPLASLKEWVNVKCPRCGGSAKRETNTMPQWAGSSWYYLAYLMQGISNFEFPISNYADAFKRWLPVDVYFGGMEHTTLHLLYSRFWHQFLYDEKIVPTPEPYAKRVPHGIILAEDGEKMSKSRGNVVNPDTIIKEFGADSLRMYELFLGPHEASVSWSSRGILGVHRFLERTFRLNKKFNIKNKKEGAMRGTDTAINAVLHKSIKKVTEDIQAFKFNTAVSALMVLLNAFEKSPESVEKKHIEIFLKLLSPFAPHLTEELWHEFGNKTSIHLEKWPEYDPALVREGIFDLVIQVNGKVRDKVSAPIDISQKEAEKAAMRQGKIKASLGSRKPKKIIFVPNRLINIVI